MKIRQVLEGKTTKVTPPKPRNFVAKNAVQSGAGAHKDKKKAAKQGDVKHKGKELADLEEGQRDDPEMKQAMRDAQRHYPGSGPGAFNKFVQRSLKHSKEDDAKLKKQVKDLSKKVDKLHESEDMEEGHYRRPGSPTAYDRDYASSVSGMGRKDSWAYQQDGGANDEGWDEEPRGKYQAPEDKPVLLGYYFYDVRPGQEQEAAIYGVKQTKSGKWAKAKYTTSGRSFGMQKDGADKAFGPGRWWAPK